MRSCEYDFYNEEESLYAKKMALIKFTESDESCVDTGVVQDDDNPYEFFVDTEAEVDRFLVMTHQEARDYLVPFLTTIIKDKVEDDVSLELQPFVNIDLWVKCQIENYGTTIFARDNIEYEVNSGVNDLLIYRV